MHNAQIENISRFIVIFWIATIANITTIVDNKSVICYLYSIIYHLRRVEDELDPPERPPPLLPPLKPPDERVDDEDGR